MFSFKNNRQHSIWQRSVSSLKIIIMSIVLKEFEIIMADIKTTETIKQKFVKLLFAILLLEKSFAVCKKN